MRGPVLVADELVRGTDMESSRTEARLKYGLFWANKLGTFVRLLHVEPKPDLPLKRPFFELFMDRGRKAHALSSVQYVFAEGDPAREILKFVTKKPRPPLLIIGARARFFRSAVTERIVSRARVPVMVVGPKVRQKTPGIGPIFVATDLSPHSLKVELFALKLAKRAGLPVILGHCLLGIPPEGTGLVLRRLLVSPSAQRKGSGDFARLRQRALKRLELRAEKFRRKGIACEVFFDEDEHRPERMILEQSSAREAALIVTGTRRIRAPGRWIGSVARAVLRSAEVPVALMPITL